MKKKNVILLGILLLVAATSGILAVTYSRYVTSVTGNASAKVAGWHIEINGNDVTTSNTFTASSFDWTKKISGNVADDTIAPGVLGETSIVLDATNTDVQMTYKISVDTTSLSALAGYSQIVVKIGEGESAKTVDFSSTDKTEYTGSFDVDDEDKIVEVPISIEWLQSEDNNESDTVIGSTISTIAIPVTVTASQYIG